MTNQPMGSKMEVMKEMEEKKMPRELTDEQKKKYQVTKERWKAENTYLFSVRLQNSTDADIIERIEAAPSRQGEIKRLVRLGLEYERILNEQKTE